MATKWEVMDALKRAKLKAPAKAVVMMLLSAADSETAAIPVRFTPSLNDLAEWTSLARSTVAEWLDVLEETGWVERTRPTKAEALGSGRRTVYRVAVGDETVVGSLKRKRSPKATDDASTVRHADRKTNEQSATRTVKESATRTNEQVDSPPGGPSTVRHADPDSPPGGHKSSSVHQDSSPPTGGDADAPPPDALFDLEDDHKAEQPPVDEKPKSNVVLAQWIDHCTAHDITLPKKVKGHYASRIAELLDQDIEPELIRDALIRMRERGFAGSPSKLGEFLVDVQNQRSTQAARAAPGVGRVSTKASVKKWKKDQ